MNKIHLSGFLLLVSVLLIVSCGEKEDPAETLRDEYKILNEGKPKKPIVEVPEQEYIPYKLGEDYDALDKPYDTGNDKKIVVYEFFSYACPHCFYFEPFINEWLQNKPDYVEFVRVPLNFQPSWEALQKAYLTAQSIGIAEKSHMKLFETIHEDHRKFKSIEELAQWYADEFDVNKNEFLSTADSFIIDSKQRKADKMGFYMQVTGTPALMINGKYRPAKNIRNRDEIINILSYLVELEAKSKGIIK